MEIHKTVYSGVYDFDFNKSPYDYFLESKRFVDNNYKDEYLKYAGLDFFHISPEKFFQEAIWVVHATGFSAKAVSKFIPRLMDAYGSYSTLAHETFGEMFSRVQNVCNNAQKAEAVEKEEGG